MNSKKRFTQLITTCVLLGAALFATEASAELKPGDVSKGYTPSTPEPA